MKPFIVVTGIAIVTLVAIAGPTSKLPRARKPASSSETEAIGSVSASRTAVVLPGANASSATSAVGAPSGAGPSQPSLKINVIRKELEKTPKSLFLIKKIKMSPDVGAPQFDPEQAQLRTVINDPILHNYKKFE